jgi:drug/metabolite transporter (DMT)-like permease
MAKEWRKIPGTNEFVDKKTFTLEFGLTLAFASMALAGIVMVVSDFFSEDGTDLQTVAGLIMIGTGAYSAWVALLKATGAHKWRE